MKLLSIPSSIESLVFLVFICYLENEFLLYQLGKMKFKCDFKIYKYTHTPILYQNINILSLKKLARAAARVDD
jgi:hypothetical protein